MMHHEYEECKRGYQLINGVLDKKPHCGWCGGKKRDHIDYEKGKIQKKKTPNRSH